MRRATTLLGSIMAATAILFAVWIYAFQTFVDSTTTITLPGDPSQLAYLVMGSAILQVLAAGFAYELRWGSVVAAGLAMAGYSIASLDGPDIYVAWAVSAGVMVALIFIDFGLERYVPHHRHHHAPPEIPESYLLDDAAHADRGPDQQ